MKTRFFLLSHGISWRGRYSLFIRCFNLSCMYASLRGLSWHLCSSWVLPSSIAFVYVSSCLSCSMLAGIWLSTWSPLPRSTLHLPRSSSCSSCVSGTCTPMAKSRPMSLPSETSTHLSTPGLCGVSSRWRHPGRSVTVASWLAAFRSSFSTSTGEARQATNCIAMHCLCQA